MSVEAFAIALVLFAAVLHAIWNTLVKKATSGLQFIVMMHAMLALYSLPFIFFQQIPTRAAWPFLLLSVLIHLVYNVFLAYAYREGDLSLIYPLARGTGPIVVALLSPFFVGESIAAVGYLGVLCSSIGIAVVGFGGAAKGSPSTGRAVRIACATGVPIGLYTLTDGMGARANGSALAYITWLFFVEGLATLAMGLVVYRSALFFYARQNIRTLASASLMSGIAYGIVIWALAVTQMSFVATLRETSVVFAALIGTLLLKEPFGVRRVCGAVLVSLGIMLLAAS